MISPKNPPKPCIARTPGLWPAMIPDFQVRWKLSSTSVGWIGGSYFFGFGESQTVAGITRFRNHY